MRRGHSRGLYEHDKNCSGVIIRLFLAFCFHLGNSSHIDLQYNFRSVIKASFNQGIETSLADSYPFINQSLANY